MSMNVVFTLLCFRHLAQLLRELCFGNPIYIIFDSVLDWYSTCYKVAPDMCTPEWLIFLQCAHIAYIPNFIL